MYTIATQPARIAETFKLGEYITFDPVYRARPGTRLPVIIRQSMQASLVLAEWGLAMNRRKVPLIPIEKVLKSKPANIWIRRNRCAIPANCFFSANGDSVYLIRLLRMRLISFGGICLVEPRDGAASFAILTTESPDILRKVTGRIPVILGAHRVPEWLSTKNTMRLMELADRSGEHWFDYFEVSPRILKSKNDDRDLLKPIGLSLQQKRQREARLKGLDLPDDRIIRNNTKGRR